TLGLHRTHQFRLKNRLLAADGVDRGEDRIMLRTITDDHVIGPGLQVATKPAVVTVVNVLDRMLAAVGSKVGAGRAPLADELNLPRSRAPLLVRDSRHPNGRIGHLDREGRRPWRRERNRPPAA